MSNISATDLTQRPPRSPRTQLGGYALLPRMLDKCRAELAGKNGDYKYACPLDQNFLEFVGIDADALKEQVAQGKGDGELLQWIQANAKHPRTPWEVHQWTTWRETLAPSEVETREFLHSTHKSIAPHRTDIIGWADMLDLDDYVSFGGKP